MPNQPNQEATGAPATAPAGVTFDFSKSIPVSAPEPQQPVGAPAGVTFDFSKSIPVTGAPTQQQAATTSQPETPGALERFGNAFAAPFKSMFHGAFAEPQDTNEIVAHAQGGQGGLIAYRAAKQLMDAHDAMVNAKPGAALHQAASDFRNAAIDLMLGNKHDALMHAVSGGLSTAGAVEPGVQGALQRPRALSEGATEGGDLATPLGSVAADAAIGAATLGAGRAATALRGAAEAGETAEAVGAGEEAAAAAPKPGTLQNIKTVIKNPKAIVSEDAAKATAQPATQSAVRGAASGAAKGANVAESGGSAAKSIEDVADGVFAKSKGLYKQIDDATGGKFSGNQKLIQNVDKELRMASSDEEVNALQSQRAKYIDQQEQMFDEAAGKGVPKETVNQAKASYKHANALYDLDRQIKLSTKGVPSEIAEEGSAPESIDPKGLSDRINKMYRSGRLQEALGEDGAKDFVNKVSRAAQSQKGALSAAKTIKWIVGLGLPIGGTIAHEIFK
jgi:hypothetical protein